jgi:hypothetical protein
VATNARLAVSRRTSTISLQAWNSFHWISLRNQIKVNGWSLYLQNHSPSKLTGASGILGHWCTLNYDKVAIFLKWWETFILPIASSTIPNFLFFFLSALYYANVTLEDFCKQLFSQVTQVRHSLTLNLCSFPQSPLLSSSNCFAEIWTHSVFQNLFNGKFALNPPLVGIKLALEKKVTCLEWRARI